MTEAAPLISVNRRRSWLDDRSEAERLNLRAKQGVIAPGIEMQLVDENGAIIDWDGGSSAASCGSAAPWVADEYVNDERSGETFSDGWYHSGDIAAIDATATSRLSTASKIW